jgi:hypothetical protein
MSDRSHFRRQARLRAGKLAPRSSFAWKIKAKDVACWHFSDMTKAVIDVRYRATLLRCRDLRRLPRKQNPAAGLRQNNPTGKSLLIFGNRVKPGNQKYFASHVGQITLTSSPRLTR